MFMHVVPQQFPVFLETLNYRFRGIKDIFPFQPAASLYEDRLFIHGGKDSQPMFGPQIEVFAPTAGRYVNDPCPFDRINRVPWDDQVIDALLDGYLREDRFVM